MDLSYNPSEDLHPKQQLAYFSQANEILYGGSAGSGKSHLIRYLAVISCLLVPGLQVYLFRRTFPDLAANHLHGVGSLPDMVAPLVQSKQCSFNQSRSTIEFFNGATIHLCHCQHEPDKYKYLGAEIHLLLIDELTTFPETIYQFLRSRVRLGGLILPEELRGVFPRIVAGTNPGGIGHNWVKQAFISPQPPGTIWKTDDDEGAMNRQFIPALLDDNYTLAETDPNYRQRLMGLGSPHLVKAMLEGDWDIVAGGAVDDVWSRDIHIIPAFEIPPDWYMDRSFDWGSSKPFAVLWWAESNGEEVILADDSKRSFPSGTLFLIKEWYGWSGKANEGCRMLASEIADRVLEIDKEIEQGDDRRFVRSGPADSSIFDVVNGNCIAADMADRGCRWDRADKSPGSRKNGLELFRQYLKASTKHPQEDAGLYVFNHCRHFIRTIPTLPRSEKNEEDVDTNAEDHIYDAARYRILAGTGVRGGSICLNW